MAKATIKKPKKNKQTKTELMAEKAKLFDRIRVKTKKHRRLYFEFEKLTRERKAKKEAMGHCENEIAGLGYALDEKHPLFDTPPEATAKVPDVMPAADNAAPANPVADEDADEVEANVLLLHNQGTGCKSIAGSLGLSERQVRKIVGSL